MTTPTREETLAACRSLLGSATTPAVASLRALLRGPTEALLTVRQYTLAVSVLEACERRPGERTERVAAEAEGIVWEWITEGIDAAVEGGWSE